MPPFCKYIGLLQFVLLAATVASLKIWVPNRCPNICRTNLTETFFECRTRWRQGCIVSWCAPSTSRRISCRLPASGPSFIRPGEQIILNGGNVGDRARVRLHFGPMSTQLDVYLLVDGTGSMGIVIQSIQRTFRLLVDDLKADSDTAFGVGMFRDDSELEGGFRNLQSITTNETLVINAVDSLQASGGLDFAEANLAALYHVATDASIGWRQVSRRVILYVADNPGHEPSCQNLSNPLTRVNVVKALNRAHVTVIAVSYPYFSLNKRPNAFRCGRGMEAAPTGQGSYITFHTGGVYLAGRQSTFETSAVVNTVQSLKSRITLQRNSCVKLAAAYFKPSLPVNLSQTQRLLLLSIVPKRYLCSLNSPDQCELTLFDGGLPLAPFRIKILKPPNCGNGTSVANHLKGVLNF